MNEPEVAFLNYVVRAIVDSPDMVRIERQVDPIGVLLILEVDKSDMGKVIGREGATAKAIRTILRVVGMRNQSRVNLKIVDPQSGGGDGI